jgi:ABC-2 type transport system ATP-binding protein
MADGPPPAWFRRRRVGLGWRPVSWQGWLVTGVAVALVIGVLVFLRSSAARIPATIAVLAVYAMIALASGGARSDAAPQPAEDEPAAETLPRSETPRAPPARRRRIASTGAPAVVAERLTKQFGERLAVSDVSFSVAAGEVFGFLGPNGAGKTTTVRMLATLLAPTSGSAVVAGLPLGSDNAVGIRQRIAVMPESPGLYLRLTVAENLRFFAGLYGIDNPEARVTRALEAVNLAVRASDLCGSLSKGLRQRAALARALLSEPTVLFLDEPTSGLDPVASHEVHDLIDGLRDRGVTIFLTTHRLEEAEHLCDRIAILNTSLRIIGRPDELRDRLFPKRVVVRTAAPLQDPEAVFGIPGVESWRVDGDARYLLAVSDVRTVTPDVARALVASDADIVSLGEAQHSLEDVYLELIDEGETGE